MQILFNHNEGAGFSDYITIEDGTTISQLFTNKFGGANPKDYNLRVNRHDVPADYKLQEGDAVHVSPSKIDNGRS